MSNPSLSAVACSRFASHDGGDGGFATPAPATVVDVARFGSSRR